MANKILKDYQGQSIKIGGVCYQYGGETALSVDTLPSEIEGVFESCLECALESSSSSSSFDPMSESSSSSGGGAPALPKVSCCSTCGNGSTDNRTNPRVNVTVTWTGGASSYTWLGETWSKGDVKTFCPYIYTAKPTDSVEGWSFDNSTGSLRANGKGMGPAIWAQKFVTYPADTPNEWSIYIKQLFVNSSRGYNEVSREYTVATMTTTATFTYVTNKKFQTVTVSTASHGNVTIKWSPIAGGSDSTGTWDNWQATTLIYT